MIPPHRIVIAGGGIIGNSIAYYLAQRDVPVVLIDPVGISPAASAKAGGFLARDWRDGTPLEQLQRTGFDLHQELADHLGPARIDYRRLTCAAVAVDEVRAVHKPPSKKMQDVEWVDRGVTGSVPMGDEETIAQVHPRKLCAAMWEFASGRGSTLRIGRVVRAVLDDTDAVTGVALDDGTVVEADGLVVACGPWTEEARAWFRPSVDLPRITGVKCHSILVPHPDRVLTQAVFFESSGPLGDAGLEIYPRPDGDCYVNGFEGEEGVVAERPGEEAVEEDAVVRLREAVERTSSELGGVEPHTVQACYWPETPDGLPLIGPLAGVPGAFVVTGHSVWGICQGPATGKAVAELLLDGKSTSVDLGHFRVDRSVDNMARRD